MKPRTRCPIGFRFGYDYGMGLLRCDSCKHKSACYRWCNILLPF